MTDEDELERIRQEKMQELQEQEEQEVEAMKKNELRSLLTEKARERLESLRMVKPDEVEHIENMILQQSGRINEKITDEELKEILRELQDDTSYDIKGMGR